MKPLPPGVKPEDWTVDKSSWQDGPWKEEPDRVDFKAHGFDCMIIRTPESGHLCGYVGVPDGHPWHGKGYSSLDDGDGRVDATVHGGITYADKCGGHICHTPKPGEPEHLWWLGFDCAHAGDKSPGFRGFSEEYQRYREEHDVYRDIPFVKAQCRKLAKQAKEAMVLSIK